jgi:hypothetical protein
MWQNWKLCYYWQQTAVTDPQQYGGS